MTLGALLDWTVPPVRSGLFSTRGPSIYSTFNNYFGPNTNSKFSMTVFEFPTACFSFNLSFPQSPNLLPVMEYFTWLDQVMSVGRLKEV